MSSARKFLDTVLDPDSFRSWDSASTEPPTDNPHYRTSRERAAERAGTDESVISGEGRVDGRRIAVVCSEFGFLGGSLGVVAAGRIFDALTRATAQQLPVLAVLASGGTRMQEGTPAFLRMTGVAAVIANHRSAGLPYLTYLRHPATGGAMASWGSLGQVTVAEPGALVGFLGPKVYRALHGEEFPEGVQTAENLLAHGLVDHVCPPAELRALLTTLLGLLTPGAAPTSAPEPEPESPDGSPSAWELVLSTRRAQRPGLNRLLELGATELVRLNGTGEGEVGVGMVLCLARFGATACVLVGHDRAGQASAPLGPADLRVARRGMRLAGETGLPLITVIDTPGAALSPSAEQGGLAGEIARCLAGMSQLLVPTVSVLLGAGCGGAALALLPADRVIAAQRSWLSALPLEGASAILHGDTDHAEETAARQRIRAADLHALGVVDRLVAERPDAADEPDAFVHRILGALHQELAHAHAIPAAERLPRRLARY